MHKDIHNQGHLYIITNSQKKNPKRITEKGLPKKSFFNIANFQQSIIIIYNFPMPTPN